MFYSKVLFIVSVTLGVNAGHLNGKEGKCEFYNAHSNILGHVYSCKIQNVMLLREAEKFIVTGTHPSKGRKDLGVKFLEIVTSNMSYVPEQLFRRFNNLEYLNINGIGIKKLTPFQNTSDMKVILANNNQIESLEANTFSVSTDLETLSLRKNQIDDIDVNAFHNLGNLRELYLSENKITTLHLNIFAPLISLEILSLSDNQIQSIDLELFHANLQLREILLYKNKITAVHPQSFNNLDSLFNLELHSNVCVDKDIRYDDGDFKENVHKYLNVCFDSYPVSNS